MRHPLGICIGAGTLEAYQHAYDGIEATDIVIERSRVHDCGVDPTLTPNFANDAYSGVHGIYIVNARGVLIRENAIYDNKYRGFQAFPYAREVLIERNVFDHNATHVNIGSTKPDGYPWRSSSVVVRDNIMSNRVTDFRPDKNPGQVHGYLPAGAEPLGNLVAGNCVAAESGPLVTGHGVEVGDNTVGRPSFAARSSGDFRQTSSSPCRGFGPTWSRPAAGGAEPRVTCDAASARVQLATVVATPSGAVTWAYSRIWYRVDDGTWSNRTWYAAQANTGVTQTAWWYQAPGSNWARFGGEIDLAVTAGRVEAWEQRYEFVDGSWSYEWHVAGTCTR